MKLWVLRHLIGDLEIFITPEGTHTNRATEALKFTSQIAAENHRGSVKSFLNFHSIEIEFEFKE